MLRQFRAWLTGGGRAAAEPTPGSAPAPGVVNVEGATPFPIARHLLVHEGMPIVDAPALQQWLSAIPDDLVRTRARVASERAWLAHLRDALDGAYRLTETPEARLLSSFDEVSRRQR